MKSGMKYVDEFRDGEGIQRAEEEIRQRESLQSESCGSARSGRGYHYIALR